MSFGQYCSQWTARELFIDVSGGSLEQYDSASQLLIGAANGADVLTANEMRLRASEFPGASIATPDLIMWAKRQLVKGHVPIIGVFNNGIALQEWKGRVDGDVDYDHIVPIVGVASDWPLKDDADYYASDVITFIDNGLYGPVGIPGRYPFLFSYAAGTFQGTREQVNNPQGVPMYMLRDTPSTYGISIEGVVDEDGQCLPVRLSCDTGFEPEPPPMDPAPDGPGLASSPLCGSPPTGHRIRLTATVDLPSPNQPCNLYCYSRFADVPVGGFNAHAQLNPSEVAASWQIPLPADSTNPQPPYSKGVSVEVTPNGDGFQAVVVVEASSNDTVVFRAVPASAP
jgi:hypothetical protein